MDVVGAVTLVMFIALWFAAMATWFVAAYQLVLFYRSDPVDGRDRRWLRTGGRFVLLILVAMAVGFVGTTFGRWQ